VIKIFSPTLDGSAMLFTERAKVAAKVRKVKLKHYLAAAEIDFNGGDQLEVLHSSYLVIPEV
jgi:hypothetical protein